MITVYMENHQGITKHSILYTILARDVAEYSLFKEFNIFYFNLLLLDWSRNFSYPRRSRIASLLLSLGRRRKHCHYCNGCLDRTKLHNYPKLRHPSQNLCLSLAGTSIHSTFQMWEVLQSESHYGLDQGTLSLGNLRAIQAVNVVVPPKQALWEGPP